MKDIWTTSKTLILAMNAGVEQSNCEAVVPGSGKVYFDKYTIAIIFGLSDLKKRSQITYDFNKEDAFIVHKENEIIEFQCSPCNICCQNGHNKMEKCATSTNNSVREGRQNLSKEAWFIMES